MFDKLERLLGPDTLYVLYMVLAFILLLSIALGLHALESWIFWRMKG